MTNIIYSEDDADDGVLADVGGADDGSFAVCGDTVDTLGGNVKLNLFFFMAPKKIRYFCVFKR